MQTDPTNWRVNANRAYRGILYFTVLCLAWLVLQPAGVSSANTSSSEHTAGKRIFLPVTMAGVGVAPAATVPVPAPIPGEWTQDAHDSQRSGFTMEAPPLPWKLLWTWNGPDSNGGTGGHFYNAPREARTVTGGSYVYVPAGSQGLFALNKNDGRPAWNIKPTSFNVTPAYDPSSGYVFAGGADGQLYKVNASNGQVDRTYQAGDAISESVLLVGQHAYVVTQSGQLHRVNTGDMSRSWVYSGNSPATIPPAYSASRKVVVFATKDLYVHAVNEGDGSQKWRVKPTPNPAEFPYTYDGYWPVVAEQHGVVFVRLNLGMAGLWSGPGPGDMYPATNAEIRAYLQANPKLKNLFALNLDNGSEKFIPAVGYGGVEALKDGVPVLDVGPVPVVKVYPDGKEVAYVPFRSSQSNPPDGRWDSHMGEMVLDNSTISGLSAGDLRFVKFSNSYIKITDEQTPLTMAGDTLFNAHWGASESTRITDRSSNLGLTYSNPIATSANPAIIRRQVSCSSFNPSTHWTSCGLTLFDDGRYWNGPGWWVYWNVLDPPTPSRRAYSEGILPRYTYVSDGLVIVEGNGGELFVLQHTAP